jgi:hypothetical protein
MGGQPEDPFSDTAAIRSRTSTGRPPVPALTPRPHFFVRFCIADGRTFEDFRPLLPNALSVVAGKALTK